MVLNTIQSSSHSFIHSFTPLFIHAFVRSFIHSFTHVFIPACIPAFIPALPLSGHQVALSAMAATLQQSVGFCCSLACFRAMLQQHSTVYVLCYARGAYACPQCCLTSCHASQLCACHLSLSVHNKHSCLLHALSGLKCSQGSEARECAAERSSQCRSFQLGQCSKQRLLQPDR